MANASSSEDLFFCTACNTQVHKHKTECPTCKQIEKENNEYLADRERRNTLYKTLLEQAIVGGTIYNIDGHTVYEFNGRYFDPNQKELFPK